MAGGELGEVNQRGGLLGAAVATDFAVPVVPVLSIVNLSVD
jgi:hypothetical protein